MYYILAFVGGALVGILFAAWRMAWKTASGYFKTEPLEDEEGFYKVNISITQDQNLLNKSTLILKRDPSQK